MIKWQILFQQKDYVDATLGDGVNDKGDPGLVKKDWDNISHNLALSSQLFWQNSI